VISSRQGFSVELVAPSSGRLAVLRRSPRTCSSASSRRSSSFILRTSSASAAEVAASSRSIESSARSVSSLENGFWCAQSLRKVRTSDTRLRCEKLSVRLNTSFQVSHISFIGADTSNCATGLPASIGSSRKPLTA